MKHFILLIIIVAVGLQGCNVGTTRILKDERIKPIVKSKINQLDEIVLKAITTNDPGLIRTIMSDKLIEASDDNIDELIEQASKVILDPNYSILNQFYVENSTTNIGNTLISNSDEINDYFIHYKALNKDMFVSILIPKSNLDQFMITNVYGKYPTGWKLNIIQFGLYKIDGKTAPELYSKAKEEYEKGYLINAGNEMALCSKVFNPANELWKYRNEDEMKVFFETLKKDVEDKYTFPLAMKDIKTRPRIFNIAPQGIEDGYFPSVSYLTRIDLTDTLRLKEENDLIQQSIGHIFKGLDKNNKYIFYVAYNTMPGENKSVPIYGFVQKLE